MDAANQGKNAGGSCQIFPALALKKLGEQKEADVMLQQCVRSAGGPSASAGTLFNAGMAEQYLGDVARAREDFKQSLIADPRYWRARIAINAE